MLVLGVKLVIIFSFTFFFFTFNRPEWVQTEGPQSQNRAGPQRGIRKGPARRPTTRKVPLNCGMFWFMYLYIARVILGLLLTWIVDKEQLPQGITLRLSTRWNRSWILCVFVCSVVYFWHWSRTFLPISNFSFLVPYYPLSQRFPYSLPGCPVDGDRSMTGIAIDTNQ